MACASEQDGAAQNQAASLAIAVWTRAQRLVNDEYSARQLPPLMASSREMCEAVLRTMDHLRLRVMVSSFVLLCQLTR